MKGKDAIVTAGEKYGELILTGVWEFRGKSQRYVQVTCVCGKVFFTELSGLKRGRAKSCGCMRVYFQRLKVTKHGFAGHGNVHPIYNSWNGMKQRCYNINDEKYELYGGKGIIVCDEWLDDFNAFKDWSLNNGWAKCLSIERKDGNRNYCPDNCIWGDYFIQNRNRNINVNITAFGETKCLQEWYFDKRCSVTAKTIRDRIKMGVIAELAITERSKTIKRNMAEV